MSEQEPEVLSPPTEQGDMPEQESTWPRTIGILSLIYAIGDLLCQAALGAIPFASEWYMGLAGFEIEVPILVKLTGSAMAVVVFLIGIGMLAGSIRLMQRKQSGLSLLKTWSVLRLIMVLFALIVAILIAPAQIQITRSILEQSNKKIREADQGSNLNKIDDEEIRANVMRQAVIVPCIFSIYPLFLGFYLSRKKITEEVQNW